jgi:Pyridoxamine 5'-phosphate oxidase
VFETAAELSAMQNLLRRSAERAGLHLRSIFTPEHALSASQVAELFRGRRQIAVATTTARGEPRVAPVDALLLHGRFCFGTHETALRIRHLRRRPAVSLAYIERDEVAIVVHGAAVLTHFGEPGFEELDAAFVSVYGGTPSTAAEGSVYVRVEPELMFTFVRDPARFSTPG